MVESFAAEILANGYPNSQLEIDDGYEKNYGDFDFDPEKFPDAKGMIKTLKNKVRYKRNYLTFKAKIN